MRATLTGAHEASWLVLDATGEEVEVAVMMYMRFEGERMMEPPSGKFGSFEQVP